MQRPAPHLKVWSHRSLISSRDEMEHSLVETNWLTYVVGSGSLVGGIGGGELRQYLHQAPRSESVSWDDTCERQRALLAPIATARWESKWEDLTDMVHDVSTREYLLPIRKGAGALWACERAINLKGKGDETRFALFRARRRLTAISYIEPRSGNSRKRMTEADADGKATSVRARVGAARTAAKRPVAKQTGAPAQSS